MKKRYFSALLLLLMLLSGCQKPAPAVGGVRIVATTYPVYLFTTAVIDGVEGVQADLMVDEPVSCLHDYTLTVDDMKLLEAADLIAMNGVGLEAFMEDALKTSKAEIVDASAGVPLLQREDGTDDPHIWMDPENGKQMLQTIADALAEQDPQNGETYQSNAAAALTKIDDAFAPETLQTAKGVKLITFHDGFEYFAKAFSFSILKAIEEEEGAETSAREIGEIVSTVKENNLPAIFTEQNGSTATAEAICRETDAKAYALSMLMSGTGTGIDPYIDTLRDNYDTVAAAFSEAGK
ncbi:MAG: metal ABC transporter substrate-binding protein [Pseudoflavonifractor sp.]